MAKKKAGLPEGYDLNVTREALLDGPVTIPGYLDDRPRFAPPLTAKRSEPIEPPKPEIRIVPTRVNYEEARQATYNEPPVVERKTIKAQRKKIRRQQINITPDIERKTDELLEILGRQSPDGKVTVSELMQALILNLYDARDNINGRLPQRGKWGTASAKSYPAELAIVLREAILKDGKGKGMDAFRTAVGVGD